MELPRPARIVPLLCLLAVTSFASPVHADPSDVDDALARLLGAFVWNALQLPSLPGDIQDSQVLSEQRGEPAVMLLTLSRPNEPGCLAVMAYRAGRWVVSEAAALPMSGFSSVGWGGPLWLGGRRVLVIEGSHTSGTAMDSSSWREFFVVDPSGSLRRVGSMQSANPDATLRSGGACVQLGAGPVRCWDASTQMLR